MARISPSTRKIACLALAVPAAFIAVGAKAQAASSATIDWSRKGQLDAAPTQRTQPALNQPPAPAAPSAVSTTIKAKTGTRTEATQGSASGPPYDIAAVLRLPDHTMLQGLDGQPISVGEVRKRVGQWRNTLAAKLPKARPQLAALKANNKALLSPVKPPGAALRSADTALIATLRQQAGAPDDNASVQATAGATPPLVPGQSPPPTLTATFKGRLNIPERPDIRQTPGVGISGTRNQPCTRRYAAVVNGPEYYLSSVNKRGRDFWVDLDAGERILVLAGCFEPHPGEVHIEGQFDGGRVKAKVMLWEEHVIVAEVPKLTGVFDQDIKVRAVFAKGRRTNERHGHLWAQRETRMAPNLYSVSSEGDCPAKLQTDGQMMSVSVNEALEAGTRLNFIERFYSPTCGSHDLSRAGVTRFHTKALAPGWTLSNLLVHTRRGSTNASMVGPGDFDVRWVAETWKIEERVFGILTSRNTIHSLDFDISQLQLRGPIGTQPFIP